MYNINVIDDLTPLRSLYGVIFNYIVVDELVGRYCVIYMTIQYLL